MKKALQGITVLLAAFFFAAIVTILASRNAAASNNSVCDLNGGVWTPDAGSVEVGTCYYPPNSPGATLNCPANYEYTIIYYSDESLQDWCAFVAPLATSGSGSGDSGGCRSEVRGPLEKIVTLAVCHGKNGAATFPIGSCALKCSVSSALPAAAARKLPNSVVATLYVRTIIPGGGPSDDTYSVCFNINDLGLDPPIIFRFVGGAWTPIAVGNPDSSVVCAAGSSEGSYCLGEPPKKE